MRIVRINISLSLSEWEKIESIIKERIKGKDIRDKGLSWFIASGINREFSIKNQQSRKETKAKIVRKQCRIAVMEDIFEEMMRQANEASIDPSRLIKRRLFDVHL